MHVNLPFARRLKTFMPKSLFARALLIMLVPMVLLQMVVLLVFYERHWDSVVRNLAFATSLDVDLLVNEYGRMRRTESVEDALAHTKQLAAALNMRVKLERDSLAVIAAGEGADLYPELYAQVERLMSQPFMITISDSDYIRITMQTHDGMLRISVPRKRVASSTTYLFVLWMVGSSLLLTVIATLFLRSQIRPMVQLARAAEQFGLGREVEKFSPRGASEVRRAGKAFVVMAERIRRQVQSRTEMLAGISHDLRTPLTRMMLEIEMAKIDATSKEALSADIQEMRHMIDEYLNFARGDADERIETIELAGTLATMVQNYQRQNAVITYTPGAPLTLSLRRQALLRALQNVMDNALRYGKTAALSYRIVHDQCTIEVCDQGPGIAEAHMAEVFRPFTRLESSRNTKTGGVGLGLAIARDSIGRIGGEIVLENIIDEVGAVRGLRVMIIIPLDRARYKSLP